VKKSLKLLFLSSSFFLYRAERQREAPSQNNNVSVSNLLMSDPDNEEQVTLSYPARQLCSTIDAFVYVVKSHDINKSKKLPQRCPHYYELFDEV